MKKSKRKGIWIPAFILEDEKLDAANKIILAEIISLSELAKGCYASDEHFGRLVGLARPSVNKRVQKLTRLGYVLKKTIKGIGKYLIVKEQDESEVPVPIGTSGSSSEIENRVPKRTFTSSKKNTINSDTNSDILKQELIQDNIEVSSSKSNALINTGPITITQFARNRVDAIENKLLTEVKTGAEIIHNAKYLNERTLWQYVDNRNEYEIVLPLLNELNYLKKRLGR